MALWWLAVLVYSRFFLWNMNSVQVQNVWKTCHIYALHICIESLSLVTKTCQGNVPHTSVCHIKQQLTNEWFMQQLKNLWKYVRYKPIFVRTKSKSKLNLQKNNTKICRKKFATYAKWLFMSDYMRCAKSGKWFLYAADQTFANPACQLHGIVSHVSSLQGLTCHCRLCHLQQNTAAPCCCMTQCVHTDMAKSDRFMDSAIMKSTDTFLSHFPNESL